MNNKSLMRFLILILAVCLAGTVCYFAGRDAGYGELRKKQEELQMLNRSSIERMDIEGDTVYVIGHKSPDSDTVCSAIPRYNSPSGRR